MQNIFQQQANGRRTTSDQQTNNKRPTDDQQASDTQPTNNSSAEVQKMRDDAEHLPASEPAKTRPISIIGNWTQHQCRRWDFLVYFNVFVAFLLRSFLIIIYKSMIFIKLQHNKHIIPYNMANKKNYLLLLGNIDVLGFVISNL